MKENRLGIYQENFNQLKKVVNNSSSFLDAAKDVIKKLSEMSKSEYAIVWGMDKENILFPIYWIGNYDFSNCCIKKTSSIINTINKTNNKSIFISDYQKGHDKAFDDIFGNLNITSLVCELILDKKGNVFILMFAKTSTRDYFTNDHLNLFNSCAKYLGNANLKYTKQFSYEQKSLLLRAFGLVKNYYGAEETNVLKGINLNIYDGEFVVILGESGCGKTTLMNILGGMDTPNDGYLEFMGRDFSKANQEIRTNYRRYHVGFIFQNYSLMPNLTAKQNLDLIGELVDNPMKSLKALQMVGLLDKEDHYPSQLSGGQQQRVSIARALIKKPQIIFADEPTAALDYATSIEVLSSIQNIVKNGRTFVMVTHNEEIAKMADRVIRIRNGKTYEVTINLNPSDVKELVW